MVGITNLVLRLCIYVCLSIMMYTCAVQTVRRKRLVQLPLGRQQSPPPRRHGMEDEYSTGYGEDEDFDRHSNYSDRSAGCVRH